MIRAIRDRLWVQKDTVKPLEVGGILIPEVCERTPRFAPTILGTVLSVGPKVKDVKQGMRVALRTYAGDEHYVRGEYITLIRERDLVGIAT